MPWLKGGVHGTMPLPLNTPLDVHALMVTAYYSQLEIIQHVFLKSVVCLYCFFWEILCIIKYICIFQLVLRCFLVAKKENLTGVSIGLTGRSKNLNPTGFLL